MHVIAVMTVEASPVTNLHLVKCVKRGGVKSVNIASVESGARIAFPQIAVDQTRFDTLAFTFEGSEQTWYDVSEQPGLYVIESSPLAVCFAVLLSNMLQHFREKHGPALFPFKRLLGLALTGINTKSKFSRGRNAIFVQLGKLAAQLGWIRESIAHIDILQQEEISIRASSTAFAPGMRFGRKQIVGVV